MNLFERAKAFDPKQLQDSKKPVGQADNVVGVMSDELRCFRGIHNVALDKANEAGKVYDCHVFDDFRARLGGDKGALPYDPKEHEPEIVELGRQFHILMAEAEAIETILWAAARLQFPELLTRDVVGIRQGFKLVWHKASQGDHDHGDLPPKLLEVLMRSSQGRLNAALLNKIFSK